jgi:hypothetical protein
VVDEGLHGLGLDLGDGGCALEAEFLEEVDGEEGDVLGAFTEGGQVDADDGESVEEVGAETAGGDLIFESFVAGGDDADVGGEGLFAADAFKLSGLEDAEELGLHDGADLGHLVEEEGAVVGTLEPAATGVVGAGEGASLVSEQLGFEEGVLEGGAVDGEEGACASAGAVDGAGDEVLSGAGFAVEEDGGAERSDALDEVEDASHLGTFGDEVLEAVFGVELEAQLLELVHERSTVEDATEEVGEAFRVGAGQVVVGAGLHGLNGGLVVVGAPEEEETDGLAVATDGGEEVEAGHVAQTGVGDQGVVVVGLETSEGVLARVGPGDLEFIRSAPFAELLSEVRLVVDEQDAARHAGGPSLVPTRGRVTFRRRWLRGPGPDLAG